MALAAGLAAPLTTASGAYAQGCGLQTCFVTSQTENTASLFVAYDGRFRDGFDAHQGRVGFKLSF